MVIDLTNKVHGQSKVFARTNTLSRYYQDIRQYEVFTKEEEKKIFNKLGECKRLAEELSGELSNAETQEKRKSLLEAIKKNNDIIGELKDAIINHNQRFVVSVARKYATDLTLMDLISEGNIGLIEAIDTYEPNKGTKFTSWAVYYIRRSINQYCMEVQPQVKQTNRQLVYHTKNSAYNRFVQLHQREPSGSELADFISDNFSKQVNELDLVDTIVSSVDEKYGDDNNATPTEISKAMSSMPTEEETEEVEHNTFVVNCLVSRLKEREQEVVKMAFGIGYDREYDLDEIARKLNITYERVRQIKQQAISRMRSLALWHHV